MWAELDRLLFRFSRITLVHGACPIGADYYAAMWVQQRIEDGYSIVVEPHRADWPKGKGAGYVRNAEMVKLGADFCLAFIYNNSPGSTHTEKLARKSEIETRTFRRNDMGINDKNVILENVRIVFKNFEGKEGQYNRKGDRNFSVVLSDEIAEQMLADNWNVKRKPPREEGEENFNHLPVAVSFTGRPPRLVLIVDVWDRVEEKFVPRRTQLDEETCEMLDYADVAKIDLILRPYDWNVSGKTGRKAYLHAIYATLNQDELEKKYQHIPELNPANEQLALERGEPEGQLALESGDDDDIEIISDTGWS